MPKPKAFICSNMAGIGFTGQRSNDEQPFRTTESIISESKIITPAKTLNKIVNMADMDTLYRSASAGNLADLDWYCQRYLNELIQKCDKTGEMELIYTIPRPDNYKVFTILHEKDRYVGGGRVSVTEDLQSVKKKVVEVVDAKRGLFGFVASTVGGLKCELFSVYSEEVKTLGGEDLSFETDQDAIEGAVKHIAELWAITY